MENRPLVKKRLYSGMSIYSLVCSGGSGKQSWLEHAYLCVEALSALGHERLVRSGPRKHRLTSRKSGKNYGDNFKSDQWHVARDTCDIAKSCNFFLAKTAD